MANEAITAIPSSRYDGGLGFPVSTFICTRIVNVFGGPGGGGGGGEGGNKGGSLGGGRNGGRPGSTTIPCLRAGVPVLLILSGAGWPPPAPGDGSPTPAWARDERPTPTQPTGGNCSGRSFSIAVWYTPAFSQIGRPLSKNRGPLRLASCRVLAGSQVDSTRGP